MMRTVLYFDFDVQPQTLNLLYKPKLKTYSNIDPFNRPLVIFSHSQISKNLQSKHCHFQTFSKLNSTFTFAFITGVVFLSTRLALLLKFLYLSVRATTRTGTFFLFGKFLLVQEVMLSIYLI